jgi:hypothetical protein
METVSQVKPIDITPRQMAADVQLAIRDNVPRFYWGNPGLGKTSIVRTEVQRALWQYCDFRAMIRDLPDLQGYPIISDMRAGEPCPMTAAPGLPSPDSPEQWAIVFEEMNGASRMMQGALYGMVLERNGLPKINRVFATGNPANARGVNNEMPAPLKSRFRHFNLVLCPDETLAYAQAAGWHPYVTAYHTLTGGKEWSSFDAKSPEETYACPRSWEDVSRTLNAGGIPANLLTPTMAGSLGYGIGQKFAAFCRLFTELAPTLDAMRADPAGCAIPADAAAQWFLSATIAANKAEAGANPAGFAAWAIPFLCRLPDELCVFAMNAATRHTPQLGRTPAFVKSFATNARYAALAQFCK